MEIEVNVPETEITGKDISVETGNTNIAVSEDTKDLDITYNRKEYSIVGDGIFMPSMYEDAPPWLKEFIDTTIEVAVTNRDQSLIDRLHAILSLLDYVPKNQYTEQINQIINEDGIINSRIATLNSYLEGAIHSTNATIAEINLTYASKDEAAAIAINALTASLSGNGEIGSALIELQEAYANLDGTIAQSISMLESVMEGEINGNATAMETIRTYVGIDEAGAGTGTGLSAYLEASDGTIGGADSQLANTIRVTAEGVESKFAYNSIVNINGVYKRSGFGLTTNYTSGAGTQANPYVSEFWIDASRFKFTNSNQTGQVAPFIIDATGATPQITFNGIVNFANTNIASGYPGTVTINGGLLEANTVTANQINTIGLIAENINANEIVGKTITGGIINGARINGAVIKASYLDLNGDLEVLTNYIITIAMYNANPSLYTDAVYISADNQYRIPTISAIQEPTTALQNVNFGGFVQGTMRPYNVANAGHNLKAVKINPRFSNTKNIIMETYAPAIYNGWGLQTVAQVRLNNTVVFEVEIMDVNVDGSRSIGTAIIRNKITNESQTGTYIQRGLGSRYDNLLLYNVPILGTVKAIVETQFNSYYDNDFSYSSGYTKVQIEIDNALLNSDLPFNWSANEGIRIYFTNRGVSRPSEHWVKGRFNGIGINNMI